jgi:hypothetical protein
MSVADDILCAPISIESWRQKCRDMWIALEATEHANYRHVSNTRNYPPGALTLEDFVELFHKGHEYFWVAGSNSHGTVRYMMSKNIHFTGDFGFDDDGFAYYYVETTDGFKSWRSIIDAQLYPNNYNDHHVFATEQEAQAYIDAAP